MTNAEIVKYTKDLDESYALQYGVPALGNSLAWDSSSARLSVATERMVVVFEPSNETHRRDDAGVGLLRWRQGVPSIGESPEAFREYRARLVREMFEEEDARIRAKLAKANEKGEDKRTAKKVAASTKEKNELARGRDSDQVKELTKQCIGAGQTKTRGVLGALVLAQTLDDAYWTGTSDPPRVLGSAWSPTMCGGDGGLGSMIAVCFDDGSLMLFSKSSTMTAFWVPEMNLSRVHVDLGPYMSDGKHEALNDIVLPGMFMGVAWSDTVRVNDTAYSLIGGITENGTLELFRVKHSKLTSYVDSGGSGSAGSRPIEERVDRVGTVRFDHECITQVEFVVSGEQGAAELLIVCGCERGAVHAVVLLASDLSELRAIPVGDGANVDLIETMKMADHTLFQSDDHVVTSLAASLLSSPANAASVARAENPSSAPKVVVAVGKTMGTLQIFVGGANASLEASIEAGKPAEVPLSEPAKTVVGDRHSISGLAFLQDGSGAKYLTAGSRLGNVVTLRLDGNGGGVEIHPSNPVHHTFGGNKLQYAGFGCYGLASSPGGTFMAFVRQAQEPDREFRMQQQIHEMVTRGILHVQSIVGAQVTYAGLNDGGVRILKEDAMDVDNDNNNSNRMYIAADNDSKVKAMSNAMKALVRAWAHGTSTAGPLWDVARLAALLETLASREQMMDVLEDIQHDASVEYSRDGDNATWNLLDTDAETGDERARATQCRFAAAMLHVLRALQGDYGKKIAKIDDWEMIAMKGHLMSILSAEADSDSSKLTRLLAIDFIASAHKSHRWIFPESFVDEATRLHRADGPAPEAGRPVSVDIDDTFVAPIVTNPDKTNHSAMDRALRATVVDLSGETGAFDVLRCPVTLQGNLDGGAWICSACKRSYGKLPVDSTHFGLYKGLVACTLCASAKLSTDVSYFS